MLSFFSKNGYITITALIFHILLGVISGGSGSIAKLYGLLILLFACWDIIRTKNRNNQAAIWAAYYVGMDVFLRVTGGFLFYEGAKYFVVVFLLLGMMVEHINYRRDKSIFVVLGLLYLPALFVTVVMGNYLGFAHIRANISGPLTLIFAGIYFYNRRMLFYEYKKLLAYFLLPIIALGFTLFIRTPDYDDIQFVSAANFATSGGFGPNQVATALGAGYIVLVIFYLIGKTMFKLKYIDLGLIFFLIFRSLFTFSRGGNFAAVMVLTVFIAVNIVYGKKTNSILNLKTLVRLSIFIVFVFVSATILNSITDNVFYNRFTGRNTVGEIKEDISANRIDVFLDEFEIFKENWIFGAGFNGSQTVRGRDFGDKTATHNEFGRLLSEHGMLGIAIIVIMIVVAIKKFFRLKDPLNKSLLAAWVVLSFATMNHSAMRIATTGFFYGLGFVILVNHRDNIADKPLKNTKYINSIH